jgi:sodium/bile acid cotransporter 7
VVCCLLLTLVLVAATLLSKLFGFNQEDRITILFCGSKKSLATGVPMAQVLFAGSTIGLLILPLMLFHQIQLMVCAVVAQRYAKRAEPVAEMMAQVDPGGAFWLAGPNKEAPMIRGFLRLERGGL